MQDVRPACMSRGAAATATPPRDRLCPILCLYLGQPRARALTPQCRTSSPFPHLHPIKSLLLRLLSLFSGRYVISFRLFLWRGRRTDGWPRAPSERVASRESFYLSCSQGEEGGVRGVRTHFSGEAAQPCVNNSRGCKSH